MDATYYINIFRDDQGILHYSTEEFSVNQDNIPSLENALTNPCRFSVLGDWHYVCTLSNDSVITAQMCSRLRELENARFLVEIHGKTAVNHGSYTLSGMAGELEIT